MNKEIITKAKSILERGLIEQIGEDFWKVDNEKVMERKGYMTCTCQNCTINVNNQTFCHRKVATILYQCQDHRLKRLIRETEEHLKQCENLRVPPSNEVIKCLVMDLKGVL